MNKAAIKTARHAEPQTQLHLKSAASARVSLRDALGTAATTKAPVHIDTGASAAEDGGCWLDSSAAGAAEDAVCGSDPSAAAAAKSEDGACCSEDGACCSEDGACCSEDGACCSEDGACCSDPSAAGAAAGFEDGTICSDSRAAAAAGEAGFRPLSLTSHKSHQAIAASSAVSLRTSRLDQNVTKSSSRARMEPWSSNRVATPSLAPPAPPAPAPAPAPAPPPFPLPSARPGFGCTGWRRRPFTT